MAEKLSHLDESGAANMVDVSAKPKLRRTATAAGKIVLSADTLELVDANLLKKGDCLAAARIAGIVAAKKTAELIPLCHNIAIDNVQVDFLMRATQAHQRSRSLVAPHVTVLNGEEATVYFQETRPYVETLEAVVDNRVGLYNPVPGEANSGIEMIIALVHISRP